MKVKVVYLLTQYESKGYFEVNEDSFKLGDIVVIEGETDDIRKYGVISNLNVDSRKTITRKKLMLANELECVLFWLDFENKLLHNKVELSSQALKSYRKIDRNNYLTDEELNNKITRNLICSYKGVSVKVTESENFIFCYGKLRITYRKGFVYNINNNAKYPSGWKMPQHKRWYFSKILGV